jgi:acyl-CoA hydrolase
MKLYYKDIAPAAERNGNGSIKGGWIFEKMDYAALTILSEEYIYDLENVGTATSKADIQFKLPIYPHDYVEIYSKISNISSSTFSIYVECKTRKRKSTEWDLAAAANFDFVLIEPDKRKVIRIPREKIDAIKG